MHGIVIHKIQCYNNETVVVRNIDHGPSKQAFSDLEKMGENGT